MSHAKGLLKGAKFNGRHSTVIPSAIPAVEAAKASGAIKMQVRGTNAVQLFWVYTNRPDEVIEEITRQWDAR